jgi:hypothetical protein
MKKQPNNSIPNNPKEAFFQKLTKTNSNFEGFLNKLFIIQEIMSIPNLSNEEKSQKLADADISANDLLSLNLGHAITCDMHHMPNIENQNNQNLPQGDEGPNNTSKKKRVKKKKNTVQENNQTKLPEDTQKEKQKQEEPLKKQKFEDKKEEIENNPQNSQQQLVEDEQSTTTKELLDQQLKTAQKFANNLGLLEQQVQSTAQQIGNTLIIRVPGNNQSSQSQPQQKQEEQLMTQQAQQITNNKEHPQNGQQNTHQQNNGEEEQQQQQQQEIADPSLEQCTVTTHNVHNNYQV